MIPLVICIVILFMFIFSICYDAYKDYRKYKKLVDSCKPGQVFHYKEPTSNPFDKSVEYDILVVDTKKNQYGKMYVKYIVGNDEYEQSCPVENFYYAYLKYTDYDSK